MTLMVVTWIVALVVLVAVVAGFVVRSRRPKPLDADWREDVAEGHIRLVGGPGMGNGGSWH